MKKKLRIQLVDYKGDIHTRVNAEILENGELLVDGFDSGDLPVSAAWDDDVEYWLWVEPGEKGKLKDALLDILRAESREFQPKESASEDENLLDLLDFVYQGRRRTFDEFKDLVEKKHIKHTFLWR